MSRLTVFGACLAASLCFAAAAHAGAVPGYTATPAGYVKSECVRTVPSGAHLEEREDHLRVTLPSGEVQRHALCDRSDGRPTFLPAAHAERGQVAASDASKVVGGPLPPDYDGWLEYTAFKDASAKGFDSFLGDFSVPDAPQSDPQVLYLFTGLQVRRLARLLRTSPTPRLP